MSNFLSCIKTLVPAPKWGKAKKLFWPHFFLHKYNITFPFDTFKQGLKKSLKYFLNHCHFFAMTFNIGMQENYFVWRDKSRLTDFNKLGLFTNKSILLEFKGTQTSIPVIILSCQVRPSKFIKEFERYFINTFAQLRLI